MPIDRHSRACCGVWSGLTAWYNAAESIIATSPTSQWRRGTGDRNQSNDG